MTLPPMVTNVIAIARQPTKEIVVNNVVRLGAERKLGVASARAASASMMATRTTRSRDGAFNRSHNVRAAEDDTPTITQLSRQSDGGCPLKYGLYQCVNGVMSTRFFRDRESPRHRRYRPPPLNPRRSSAKRSRARRIRAKADKSLRGPRHRRRGSAR